MSYSIRRMKPESEFNPEVSVGSLNRVITEEALSEVIAECDAKEQRERKLPTRLVMLICVAMSLWSQSSLEDVVDRLFQGEHLLAGLTLVVMPVKSAISAARYRVGTKPMERLFKRVCQPLATPATTTGAFAFGLRMMAIDGSIESVADSPANDAYFGRSVNGRSE